MHLYQTVQLDENGFLIGRKGDWVFIDWADFDREGALCAEQMLYLACWKAMSQAAQILEKESVCYQKRYEELKQKVQDFYWDKKQGAFIDSYVSGKQLVTRHAYIFAVIFDIAEGKQKQAIVENVLNNPKIPAVTTPYFKFYEMDALARMGYLGEVLQQIKDYWGGMLERGAVTFWEEYDPKIPQEEQYDMYGDKFGKSLCYAWSASPVYLLAKYFAGFELMDPASGKYEVNLNKDAFEYLDCTLPAGKKNVHIHWNGNVITVTEKEQ